MESRLWILFTLVCIYHHTDGSVTSLKATINKETANIGDSVTFTCTVTKSTADASIGITIGKVLMLTDGSYQDQEINRAGTDQLQPRFSNLERYTLNRRVDGLTEIFELAISGVEREDNAPIGCMEVVEADYEVSNFIVNTPVNDVYFGNLTSASTVTFEEGDAGDWVPLNCTALGGSPAADITIVVLEGSTVTHDYTSEFRRHVINEVECPAGGSLDANSCIMHRRSEVTMSTDNFVPLPEHNGKQLVCRGRAPNQEQPATESRILMNIFHKPAFACSDHHQVDLHVNNYEVRCLVYANPPADDRNAYFEFQIGPLNEQLKRTETSDDGTITVRQESSDEMANGFEIILTINTVTEEHWTTYTLVASNDRGESRYPIYLTKVGGRHPGAASAIQAMSFLATATIAVVAKLFL